MKPWDVIQEALAHRKPPRDQKWLAKAMGVSAQAITNWKVRGVPAAHYRAISTALGITIDQLEGLEALPWAMDMPWPFSPELYERIARLNDGRRQELENVLWSELNKPTQSGPRLASSTSDAGEFHPPKVGGRQSHDNGMTKSKSKR